MNELQAASILDPNTRREALQPYELDCVARLAVVEEACRVAARTLRLTHNSGPLMIDTSILSDEQCKHLLEEKGKAAQYPLQVLPGSFGRTDKMGLLTLEQLQEMDGEPVYLPEVNCWVLVTKKTLVPLLTFPDGEQCNAVEWYEAVGPAYSYPPSHVDREAWRPCGACKSGKITIHVPEFRAMAVCNQHMDHEAFDLTLRLKFCPWCGRPMTPEAWSELEEQLRGMKV